MQGRWWDEWPSRLEYELSELEALGHSFEINKYEEVGRLEITVAYSTDTISCTLIAKFPREYPFFSVEIWCPDQRFGRHQDPVDGRLCTIHDIRNEWHVNDTLAGLLREQFPQLLRIVGDPDGDYAADHEFHQGDPITGYARCQPNSAIVVGAIDVPKSSSSGRFRLALTSQDPFRGAVVSLTADGTNEDFKPESWICEKWSRACSAELEGRWCRIDNSIDVTNPTELLERVFGRRLRQLTASTKWRFALAIIDEEVRWRENHDGWLIAAFPPNKRQIPGQPQAPFFIRTDRMSDPDLFGRVPEVRSIRDKHIVVVGLGMLGSPAVLHLARAGVGRLTIVDNDIVEGSTIVRWGLGLEYTGVAKTVSLKTFLAAC